MTDQEELFRIMLYKNDKQDVARVWTAEEILGELPGYMQANDPGHYAMLEAAAAHWAHCTRVIATIERREVFLASLEPLDEKAQQTIWARRNELERLRAEAGDK